MLRFGLMFSVVLLTVGAIMAAGVWAALVAVGAISAPAGLRVAAFAILVGGVALIVLAAGALRRRIAPIGALIEAAAQIERGDYSVRVPERGGREVRALARTFNTMSARLSAIDSQRRSFLADVAHELRTPLAIMRGRLEAMLDGIHPRDDGAGISSELLPHVFERFVRGPDSRGSGLGLPIVADIAAAHGGSATAASTPGEGTTVTLVIPVRA